MNNFTPFNQSQSYQQPYQPTQFFPQPQGNVYMIGNAAEVTSIPVGTGVSAAISLRDNVLYLKTFQNGTPAILAYRIVPLDNNLESQQQTQPQVQPQNQALQQKPQSQIQLQTQSQVPMAREQLTQDKKIIAVIEDYEKRITALEDLLTLNGGRNQ